MSASLLRVISTPLARACPAQRMPLPRAARGHAVEDAIELLSSSASSSSSSGASASRPSPARAPRRLAKRRPAFEGLQASVTAEAAQAHSDRLERERLAWVQLMSSTSRAQLADPTDEAMSHRAAKGKGKARAQPAASRAAPAPVRRESGSMKAPARPRAGGAARRAGQPQGSRQNSTLATRQRREAERAELEMGLDLFTMESCAQFFGGRKPAVAVTACPHEAAELLACMPRGVPLSVDAEWPFNRVSGATGKISLLQIASPSMVLLLQLGTMRCVPDGLRELMADESSWKYGVAIRGDANKLFRDWGVRTRSLLELSTVAKLADPERWASRSALIALRDLTRIYIQRRLNKDSRVRASTWSMPQLEDQQVEYAACDVVAGTAIMRELVRRLEALQQVGEERPASTVPGWFQARRTANDSRAPPAAPPATDASLHMSAGVRTLLQAQLTHVEAPVEGEASEPRTTYAPRAPAEEPVRAWHARSDVKRTTASRGAPLGGNGNRSTTAAGTSQRRTSDDPGLLAALQMTDSMLDGVEAAAHGHERRSAFSKARRADFSALKFVEEKFVEQRARKFVEEKFVEQRARPRSIVPARTRRATPRSAENLKFTLNAVQIKMDDALKAEEAASRRSTSTSASKT